MDEKPRQDLILKLQRLQISAANVCVKPANTAMSTPTSLTITPASANNSSKTASGSAQDPISVAKAIANEQNRLDALKFFASNPECSRVQKQIAMTAC